MTRTNAERQADWYQRHRDRDKAMLAENERLQRTVGDLESALSLANQEIARLSETGPDCPHPSEAVDNGRCTACGDWL